MNDRPPGLEIDAAVIGRDMARRAPGQGWMSTKRREPDAVRIVSGVYAGHTTGTPVCGVIENADSLRLYMDETFTAKFPFIWAGRRFNVMIEMDGSDG